MTVASNESIIMSLDSCFWRVFFTCTRMASMRNDDVGGQERVVFVLQKFEEAPGFPTHLEKTPIPLTHQCTPFLLYKRRRGTFGRRVLMEESVEAIKESREEQMYFEGVCARPMKKSLLISFRERGNRVEEPFKFHCFTLPPLFKT